LPFVILTVISNRFGERRGIILFLGIIIVLDRGAWLWDRLGTHSCLFFFVLVIFLIQSRSPCFIHNIYYILFSGSASVWNYGLAYFEVEKALLWHLHESAFEIKKNYFPKKKAGNKHVVIYITCISVKT